MYVRALTVGILLTASTAAQGAVTCPGSNSTQYISSNGATFVIECGLDHAGGDLSSSSASSFQACIDICANNTQCVDVSYSGTVCYLKSVLKPAAVNGNVNAARLLPAGSTTTTSTSAVVAATAAAAASPASTLSCPSANGTAFSSNGNTFNIECAIDHSGGDLSSVSTGSLDACIAQCAATSSCVDVSYVPSNGMCYLKSQLNAGVANTSVWSARVGALTCPSNNGTVYNVNGTIFSLECYLDRAGGDLKQVTAGSWENCMGICVGTASCVDASYVPNGGACYLKSSQVSPSKNNNVWGARILSNQQTASTPATTTNAQAQTTAAGTAGAGAASPVATTVTSVSTRTVTSVSVSTSTITSVSVTTSTTTSVTTAVGSASTASAGSAGISSGVSSTSNFAQCQASFATGSTGCGLQLPSGQTPGGQSQVVNFTTASGTLRTYLVYIPSTYSVSTRTPLILSYHGASATSQGQEGLTGFSTTQYNTDTIVVYPQGINGYWQGAPYSTAGVDDVAFTTQLLANLSATYCVDPNRVYASGFSNGGGFVGTLACDPAASLLFAAYGVHSGAFYPNVTYTASCDPTSVSYQYPSCLPGRAHIPIIEFHGYNDTQIPYFGGAHNNQCLPTIPHWATAWAAREGYPTTNVTTNLGSGNFQYQFGTSAAGAPGVITHYEIFGLGHSWATAFNNFTSSPLMLSFFKQWILTTV